jgi:predicted PP-loop superfamily ATPase
VTLLVYKGLTHKGKLYQCGRNSQVIERFVVSALVKFVSYIVNIPK